ncbi:MAG: acyl dehydratase, partial [Pseudomonadota bacterium]|nr:acyl dehydratase [Pseudomonadota bacterium]
DPERERYFEDCEAGTTYVLGQVRVDGEATLAFLRPMIRKTSILMRRKPPGAVWGLIASGWYTAGLVMPFMARHFLSNASSLGSSGIDGLRWLAPMRPDETLTIQVSILETRRAKSKPDRDIVR